MPVADEAVDLSHDLASAIDPVNRGGDDSGAETSGS
jgi:hypothetical protein